MDPLSVPASPVTDVSTVFIYSSIFGKDPGSPSILLGNFFGFSVASFGLPWLLFGFDTQTQIDIVNACLSGYNTVKNIAPVAESDTDAVGAGRRVDGYACCRKKESDSQAAELRWNDHCRRTE
jgi:hypothetical protein